MSNRFYKDVGAVKDYLWDWTDWLNVGETILSFLLTFPAGLTKDSESNTDQTVTAWISGGSDASVYIVTCAIVTSDGREDERNIIIQVDAEV